MASATFDVRIEVNGDKVAVHSPYSHDFVQAAKQAGGRWNPKARTWEFPAEAMDNVRAIVRGHYGADPLEYEGQPLADVVIRVPACCEPADGSTWFLAGRLIAERRGRDSHVRIGRDVVILQGAFAPSGGSRRRPLIGANCREDIVLLVKNVPVGLAERLAELHSEIPEKYRVGFVVEEVRPHPSEADQAQAALERAMSLARELAEAMASLDQEAQAQVMEVIANNIS